MTGMLLEFGIMDIVYSVMGYALVFVVLALLIACVLLLGKIITSINGKKEAKSGKAQAAPQVVEPAVVETNVSDEEEIAAVITAAIMMCMETQENEPAAQTNTGFVVRKIKKI